MGKFIDALNAGMGSAVTGGITGAVGTGLGAIFGGMQDRRQLKQQQKLTDMQLKANQAAASYNKDISMDMWNKTNYGAQMEHIKAAGLNPALIYGTSGSGGSTIAGTTSGVSGGQAANAAQTEGMALQHGMMKSQIDLATSQARKNNAEADDLEGTTPQGKEKLGLMRLDKEMKKIDLWIKGITQSPTVESVRKGVDKLDAEIYKLNEEGLITASNRQFTQDTFKQRVAQLTKSLVQQDKNIQLTDEQAKQLVNWMAIESDKLKLYDKNLEQQKQMLADQLKTILTGKWIDAGSRVIGDLINLIPSIKGLFGKLDKVETLTEVDRFDAEGEHKGSTRTTTTSTKPAGRR